MLYNIYSTIMHCFEVGCCYVRLFVLRIAMA